MLKRTTVTCVGVALAAALLNAQVRGEDKAARIHLGPLGPKQGLFVKDNLAYYISKTKLKIVDVTDPAKIAVKGELEIGGLPEDLLHVGHDIMYATDGLHLIVLDVSKPLEPALVKRIAIGKSEVWGPQSIEVKGDRLYIAARRTGLVIADISNPKDPKILTELAVPGVAQSLIVADDNKVYLATGKGVALVSATNDKPELISFCDTTRGANSLVAKDNWVMAGGKEYFTSIDFSDAEHPKAVAELPFIDLFYYHFAYDMVMVDHLVYVAASEGCLYILDWNDKAKPMLAAQYGTWANKPLGYYYIITQGLYTKDGGLVYMTDEGGKLWVLSVSRGKERIRIRVVAEGV